MSRPPFKNEPFTDFSDPDEAAKFEKALVRVQASLGRSYTSVIGGNPVASAETFDSRNPTRPDEILGHFPLGSVADADRAVAAALDAFPAWSALTFAERAQYLFAAADRVRHDKHDWSAWMVEEVGKSWAEADGDTAEAIDFLEYYGHQALRYGQGLEVVQTADRNDAFYLPLGVGAVIAPWNFPFAILCGTVVGPVVAGNTVVMKPAEDSPTIAARFMALLESIGLPPGVVNLLYGRGSVVGARLVEHPETRFVSFTGSRDVGLWIVEAAAKRVPGQRGIKRVVAEMGGKDAIVVDAVKDLDRAAAGTVAAAFGYQGQKCSACSRAIVVDAVYEPFLASLVEHARTVRLGDPSDPAVNFGPLVSEDAFEKTKRYIEIGHSEGRLLFGGGVPDREGWFVEPTIFADVAPDARLAQDEIFGPVLAVIRARDFDHALEIANGTEYGLTGAVYTDVEARVDQARRTFHVGNLYVNRKCTGALVGAQPFGGFNMSGTCSKAGGPDYLGLFLQTKSVARHVKA